MTHMIVVGCGRVGSTTARELAARGHDVVVVDRRKEAFRRLGADFPGSTVTGVGFDRDVLREAKISPESGVMAVTSGDNSNILIARVAREMFGVSTVVARIYDPRRAAIYQRIGIPTVATVTWATDRILSIVDPEHRNALWTEPTSGFSVIEHHASPSQAGRRLGDFGEARILLVLRNGRPIDLGKDGLVQEGDSLFVAGMPTDFVSLDEEVRS